MKPDNGRSQLDGGEETASGFVITGGDSTELFEFLKEILNQMACLTEFLIVGVLELQLLFLLLFPLMPSAE